MQCLHLPCGFTATAFTICEKKEFNVNIRPINAQTTIQSIVL